jgi:ankyrin repeat protein
LQSSRFFFFFFFRFFFSFFFFFSDLIWCLNSGETARYLANLHPGAESLPASSDGGAMDGAGMMKRTPSAGVGSSSMAEMDRRSIFTAIQGDNIPALAKLIKTKVKANLADELGTTPLHEAAVRVRPRCARLLLMRGAQWSAKTRAGVTPLHQACSAPGGRDLVEMLMRAGAPVGTVDASGRTPLHYAADRGCADNVRALLGVVETVVPGGREISFRPGAAHAARFRDHAGRTPLVAAVSTGHADVADLLCLAIGREDVSGLTMPDGTTVLHNAAAVGSVECVDVLFKHGAEVNAIDNTGATPLHVAVRAKHAQVATRLVHLGARTDVRNLKGLTALALAVSAADLEAVEALVDGGASASIGDKLGMTPVHIAARTGSVEILARLLRAGPDTSLRTADGATAADLARRAHQLRCSEMLAAHEIDQPPPEASSSSSSSSSSSGGATPHGAPRKGRFGHSVLLSRDQVALQTAVRECDEAQVRALVGGGAVRVDVADAAGVTALHEAAFIGDVHVAATLISAGASVNVADRSGQSPLHYAAQSTVSACVRLLLTEGALPDLQDSDGWTPLAVAAARGDARSVRIIVQHSPQTVTRTDKAGWSPLHRACEQGHAEVCEALIVELSGDRFFFFFFFFLFFFYFL